jgi:hypothetical protein
MTSYPVAQGALGGTDAATRKPTASTFQVGVRRIDSRGYSNPARQH